MLLSLQISSDAWPGRGIGPNPRKEWGLGMVFTSVVTGVVDAAMAYTRQRLMATQPQHAGAFQQVEWAAVSNSLAHRAGLKGAMHFDQETQNRRTVLLAKTSVARLAECSEPTCKCSGGSAVHLVCAIGAWFEDVRALATARAGRMTSSIPWVGRRNLVEDEWATKPLTPSLSQRERGQEGYTAAMPSTWTLQRGKCAADHLPGVAIRPGERPRKYVRGGTYARPGAPEASV